MIQAYELTLLASLQNFWNSVVSNVGTGNDLIPDIFANLPATGDFGANWSSIGANFKRMATGSAADDVSFILQFPAGKAQIPSVCVQVGTETPEDVVGGFIQEDYNPINQQWEKQIGSVYTKNYTIGIYGFNADTTSYLYSVVKYGLIVLRNTLPEPSSFVMSGRPLQVDYNQFSPDIVYSRMLDIRVEGLIDSVIQRYGRINRVIATNSGN